MRNFFTGRNIRIILHVFAWTILLGLPIYIAERWEVGKDFVWLYYSANIISGIIFYINYLFLVPKFFFARKNHRYYLSVLMLLVFFYFVSNSANELIFRHISGNDKLIEAGPLAENDKGPGPPGPQIIMGRPPFRQVHLFNYAFTSLFLVFFSMGLRVLERHSLTEKLQKELEREKLNSELAFLKNQISPHFFFNTLNNIYSLISVNAEDSQKAVLKLSKLMRYLLYESDQGNTLLSNEIAFMINYIDLMKLRMSDKIGLSVSFPENPDEISIPPLLFIPFIENAFKHGISYREKSFIDIRLDVEKDALLFTCKNSLFKTREDGEPGHSGIGLDNVSKRLNLLFPGKHDLHILKSDSEFEVKLNISFT